MGRTILTAFLVSSLALPAPLLAAQPCTEQNYSDSKKEPRYDCPGPDEAALVPNVPTKPSLGVPTGTELRVSPRKSTLVDFDAVLLDKMKVIELGMRIKALRRLRWLERHKGKDLLAIEKKYVSDRLNAKLKLEQSRVKSYKQQRDDARAQRNKLRAWYRSPTLWFAVGFVVSAAGATALGIALRK